MSNSTGLIATYQLTLSTEKATDANLQKLAEQIAVGQTIGTANAGEMEALQPYLAEVVSVTSHSNPLIKIGFPAETVKSDLGTLLAVVFGKISMGGQIRLVDLEIGPQLAERYAGPRFGMTGVRELTGAAEGPLLMSIFKPCLGVSAETLGEMFYTQALGGVNLVKDDEVLSDPDFESARYRLECCLQAADMATQETGQKTLYAINLTGPAEQLLHRARTLVQDGATAILFNYLCYGLPMLNALRQDPDITVPLVAHPALAGAFYGSPFHGVSPQVLFGTLPRLAGADLVLFPSPYGSVSLPMADAQAVSVALTHAGAGLKPAFPVPSAGIQAEMIPKILADFGSDVVINAGTGIYDHPIGAYNGVQAFVRTLSDSTAALTM